MKSTASTSPTLVNKSQALKHPLQSYVDQLFARHRECHEGEVATYIPELGRADPNWFAIAIATTDGHLYLAGDNDQTFTIQSISKPFVYGLAIEDHGLDFVSRHVGVEPSGDAFNSISLDPITGRPMNPMINAGAITSTGLVCRDDPAARMNRILEMFGRFTGREVGIDEEVYRSESSTGFRNRAIANLLRNFNMVEGTPDNVVEDYFKQCSILMSCRDLAMMAATLAAGGRCPLTGNRAMSQHCVRSMLSVMATCGMYDFSGEWLFRVGMPAKSGVAGGIIGVLPGQFGVAVFSPRLDARGNSVRGIRVFNDLADLLGMHIFNQPRPPRTFIRSRYDASRVRSKRLRPVAQMRWLEREGAHIRIWDLQGHLLVYSVELIARDLFAHIRDTRYFILDFRRITGLEGAAAGLLAHFIADAQSLGAHVLLSHADHHPALLTILSRNSGSNGAHKTLFFSDADAALEWCEDELLEGLASPQVPPPDRFGEFELLRSMTPGQLEIIRALISEGRAADGELIIRASDAADRIYFLLEGSVSVMIDGPEGKPIRLATTSSMMSFGEMALLDRRPRSANVRADGPVRFLMLPFEAFERIQSEHPEIAITLLANLARGLSEKLRRANEEIGALSG